MKEKIDAIKTAKSNLGSNVSFDAPGISRGLEIDEILSDDYERALLPLIGSGRYGYAGDNKSQSFVSAMESDIGSRIAEKFTASERKRLIDKYIRLAGESGSVNIRSLKVADSIEGYLMSQLISTGSVEVFLKSDSAEIAKYLDDAMLTSNYATIKGLYDSLSKRKDFEYNNWPIVIINKNLTQDQKIEIIKSTYRQKDMAKYTDYIRSNIVDMTDLDSFIEATIIQNNRMTEKDKNVIDVIKRIFVGVRGKNYGVDLKKFQNKDSFFDKYRKYFRENKGVIEQMAEDESSYYSRNNSVKFLGEMFAKVPFAEKLEIASLSSNLGRDLIEDLENSELTSDILNDPATQKAFCEYMISRSEGGISKLFKSYGKDKTLMLIEKNRETFFGPVTKTLRINSGGSSWNSLDTEESLDMIMSLSDEFVSDERYTLVKDKDRVRVMGFAIDSNSWRTTGVITDFYRERLPGLKLMLKSNRVSKALREKVYKVFFEMLEDDDFVRGDLLNEISKIISGDNGREIADRIAPNSITPSNVVDFIVHSYRQLVSEFYPEKLAAINPNLDVLAMNLKVIIGI
jgi:hypothetical protein